MPCRPFFTQSPRLAFLRRLVKENAVLDFSRADLSKVFEAVDSYCSNNFPTEERGGWFSPMLVGGALVNHTPPHLVFSTFAIYMSLVNGSLEPCPFLDQPLNMDGTTAVQLDSFQGYWVESCDREIARMTDILIITHLNTPEKWTLDLYGIPSLNDDVIRIGCHAHAEDFPRATASSTLLLHPATHKVINPLAPFTRDEERLFFSEPINESRLERHRERLSESFGTPVDVMERNHENAKRVLEAYVTLPVRDGSLR